MAHFLKVHNGWCAVTRKVQIGLTALKVETVSNEKIDQRRRKHCALAVVRRSQKFRHAMFVYVCGWVCYHDNSKLRPSILTKLGL